MNPEVRHHLFLACLRTELTDDVAADLSQLPVEAWEQLLDLAAQQRVGPLMYQRLKAHRLASLVPAPTWERWKKLYFKNAGRNLRLYHELGQILRALRERHIPVLVLKGGFLASAVYRDPALRYMSDIDLLVPPGDVPAALERLLALGYQSSGPFIVEQYLALKHHLPPFGKPGAMAAVEVHWSITSPDQPWAIAPDELWTRAVPATIAGVKVLSLCPEDLLLHLCLHATYHHLAELFWQGISPLCDVDQTVRHYQTALDWDHVRQRADAWGWGKGVYLILYLARELLKTPIPDQVLSSLQPASFSTRIAEAAITQLLADKRPMQMMTSDFARLWGDASLVKKARLFLSRLFPPPRAMALYYPVPYNSPKIFLYYPARFRHLFRRYSSKVWRLWRGDQEIAALTNNQNTVSSWLEQS